MELGVILAIGGAALAVALAGIGSSIGIGYASQAADGVLSEEPDKFVSTLILSALPGTQGIYGFVGAFLVINKIGLLGEAVKLSTGQGWQILLACIPVGVGGLFSGIHQGKVSAAGMAVVAKQAKDFMKSVVLSALVETYAVLGLLITVLLLMGIKV